MAELLDDAAVRTALSDLTGWTGDTTAVKRTVKASDFPTAIRIVDDVATIAEASKHHPDIDIRWRTLHFTLSTHSAGGVTRKDVDLAEHIDEIVARHAGGS
ncbi:MAG: 4a-hydroxytetrahydrobiopterin dehydratase [Streptosporangiales bacterium]|nr:4a-hydroxytetrahydrobiopterin dehydratase [Streptosporangiales bacterium]